MDNFVLNLLCRPSQFVQLMVVNMLTRNVDGAATDVSIVEK